MVATAVGCSDGAAEATDAAGLDQAVAGDAEIDGGSHDGRPIDGGRDAHDATDRGLTDATEPGVDAEPISDDPYVQSGAFDYLPGPPCIDPLAVVEDLTDQFEEIPFPTPGGITWVGDIDGNGRAELYVYNRYMLEEPEFIAEPDQGYRASGIFELAGDEWVDLGALRGMVPYGAVDLDGDGRQEIIGSRQYLAEARADAQGQTVYGFGSTFGIRQDKSEMAWRYDHDYRLYVREVREGHFDGFLPAGMIGDVPDMEVTDADQDGWPEILFYYRGVLAEWDGDDFVRVFEPTDPLFGFAGSTGPSTVGDFDGDGQMELALATFGPEVPVGDHGRTYLDQHFRILENRGDNTYVHTQRLALRMTDIRGAAAGDVNGDGIDDLLVAAGPVGCVRYQLWTTAGDDTLALAWERDVFMERGLTGNTRTLTIADVDGDGDQEMVVIMDHIFTVWDWRVDEARREAEMVQIHGERVAPEGYGWPHVYGGDLDGDGIDEVVTWDAGTVPDVDGQRAVWANPRGVLIRRYRGE